MSTVFSREGEISEIPISSRIIKQQAVQTVRHLIDAIVELVTNADDSYRRLETAGQAASGHIVITLRRHKGGGWDYLVVEDKAEGMGIDKLLAALEYGGAQSGFERGRTVRGMFGRGLKESIIALGEGEITSVRGGLESKVRIWWDDQIAKAQSKIEKDSHPTSAPDATTVRITPRNTGVKCPEAENLRLQVANHFALRDITVNKKRSILVIVENLGGARGRGAHHTRLELSVAYKPPPGHLRTKRTETTPLLGPVDIEISESDQPLRFTHQDPCSEAGLLVTTEGAALDLSLFGYESDPAAAHFFGRVHCPGLTARVRAGDHGLIDSARGGLRWKADACAELFEVVQHQLAPLIEARRKLRPEQHHVPEAVDRKLRNICSVLNRLARLELEQAPNEEGTDLSGAEAVTELLIKPSIANAEPNRPRAFSVYLPRSLARPDVPPVVEVSLDDIKGEVRLVSELVDLREHRTATGLLIGRFLVVGEAVGNAASVYASYENQWDVAQFRVQTPKSKRRPRDLAGHGVAGMFRDVRFDSNTENPTQRVYFSGGTITICLRFPTVSDYIGDAGRGCETSQGSLMLAELVNEAFCRELARRKLPDVPVATGGQVDAYNNLVNDLMARHLWAIHKALVVT